MKKKNKQKKPKSRKKLRYSKRQNLKPKRKKPKIIVTKSKIPKQRYFIRDDLNFQNMFDRTHKRLLLFDSLTDRFYPLHPEAHALKAYEWQGLLTLKFYRNDSGKDMRVRFLEGLMENLRVKLGISDREFNWVACNEFGSDNCEHLHVIFSFDYLRDKKRMDRLKISDFSEKGQFFVQGEESVGYICRKMQLKRTTVDFQWEPKSENEGLVGYFCTEEYGIMDKIFIFSKFWEKMGLINAA